MIREQKETTSITLPASIKRLLEKYAERPEYLGIHGRPNQSKVIQAALERLFREEDANIPLTQFQPTNRAIDVLRARCEGLLSSNSSEIEISKSMKEIKEILETHSKVLVQLTEGKYK